MRKHPIALALAGLALIAPAAQAHGLGARLTIDHPHHHAKATIAKRASLTIGMGDVRSLGCAHLPLAGTSFVRVIVGYQAAIDAQVQCAENARAAGLRVELVIQWAGGWDLPTIRQRFADAIATFKDTHPFAVAIGNEQELRATDGKITPQQYVADWRALKPAVRKAFPAATLVAGEISPWGNAFMATAAKLGLPGAQAYAAHVYPTSYSGAYERTAAFARIARQHGVQAWADEGMCGPSAWIFYGCTSAEALRRAGYSLAAEWYASPTGTIPTAGTATIAP